MNNFFYEVRKNLHEMPEIALQEYNTSKYIRDFLTSLNIKYVEIERTTLAIFEGEEDRWKGFRADIDALPIQEEGEKDYK